MALYSLYDIEAYDTHFDTQANTPGWVDVHGNNRFEATCFYNALEKIWPMHFSAGGQDPARNFSWRWNDPRNDERTRVYLWSGSYMLVRRFD